MFQRQIHLKLLSCYPLYLYFTQPLLNADETMLSKLNDKTGLKNEI